MLVLSRKVGESIRIGESIELRVNEVQGGRVRIAISAPKEVTVLRGELLNRTTPEPVNANRGDQQDAQRPTATFAC